MLDTKDFQMLEKMFSKMLRENNGVFGRQLKREIRDEMQALLRIQKGEIIADLTDFMSEQILPQIDDHESRLVRLEHRVA